MAKAVRLTKRALPAVRAARAHGAKARHYAILAAKHMRLFRHYDGLRAKHATERDKAVERALKHKARRQ